CPLTSSGGNAPPPDERASPRGVEATHEPHPRGGARRERAAGASSLAAIGIAHGVDEGLGHLVRYERHRAAAEPGARHPSAEAAELGARNLADDVQLGTRHLVEIAQARVRLVHEVARV